MCFLRTVTWLSMISPKSWLSWRIASRPLLLAGCPIRKARTVSFRPPERPHEFLETKIKLLFITKKKPKQQCADLDQEWIRINCIHGVWAWIHAGRQKQPPKRKKIRTLCLNKGWMFSLNELRYIGAWKPFLVA
jgi:hypothetical protein